MEADPPLDPSEFLRTHLKHPEIPYLVPSKYPLPVYHNVVSNVKLNPSPAPTINLLRLLNAFSPNCEHKESFGAIIVRFMHGLTPRQRLIEDYKEHAVTHLCFSTGALGGTGNRSKDEAILAAQEFRKELYDRQGIITDFWRFTIPNMVGSGDLGHSVDLAALHAEAPKERPFEPDLFPGAFLSYTYTYEDRAAVHETIINSKKKARRTVEFVEGDFEQFQNRKAVSTPKGAAPPTATEEAYFTELQAHMENFLPSKKEIVILVFKKGNVVLLGINDLDIGSKAMKYVADICAKFKPSAEMEAEWASTKKQQAQKSLAEKTRAKREVAVNKSKPFSVATTAKISELANERLSAAEYSERLVKILAEEKAKKKKRKGKQDEGLEVLEFMSETGTAFEVLNQEEAEAEIDRIIREETEETQSGGAPASERKAPAPCVSAGGILGSLMARHIGSLHRTSQAIV